MKAFRYWLQAIAIDATFFGGVYAWQVLGIEGWGNVAIALVWVMSALQMLIGFTSDKTSFTDIQRPAGFITYHRITSVGMFFVLAYIGYFVAAIVSLIAHLAYEAARTREPKKQGGAA